MRNLVRRALDKLTGAAPRKADAAQAAKTKGAKTKAAANTPPETPGTTADAPAAAARGPGKRVAAAAGGRTALIENALAIQRDQAGIFDQLQPAERKRLQALARRTFAPVLKDEPAAERKPAAPAPAKPGSAPGRRRP